MKTIAYQGFPGAYSHLTAVKEFGPTATYLGVKTFKEMFLLVEDGRADNAVVAIENSTIGSIYENYDLLQCHPVSIVGERFAKIEHCLLASTCPGQSLEQRLKDIKRVSSHPKALQQCTRFFQEHPWIEAVIHVDTAGAAQELATHKSIDCAAIASAESAELYGLEVLKAGIQDNAYNYTRFVSIAKEPLPREQANKCSLMIKLDHFPGALAKVVGHFAESGLNLTKIESRPLDSKPFEYVFYLDLAFDASRQKEVHNLISQLEGTVRHIQVLGFYQAGVL